MAAALPFIAVGAAGLSAVAQLKSGQATAGGLRSQATQARMQAKGEELKYKQQGVAVLDNILQTQATINARAGAGSIDPYSGSAGSLAIQALAKGALEKYMTVEGQIISLRSGELQAQEYESAARSAMSQARMGAIMSLAQGAFNYAMLGGPGLGGGASAGVNPFAGGTPTGVGLPGGEFGMTNLNMSGYGQLGARF
jgi:hypothetical protein